ncbi:MAG TPA: VCBS repeat-containing protein [Pyrinomonadaceae bacterium]
MKSLKISVVVLLLALCLLVAQKPPSSEACGGSTVSVCVVTTTACLKTMVMSQAVPLVVVVPPATSTVYNAPVSLYLQCPTQNNCGAACMNGGGVPSTASISISLVPFPGATSGITPTASGMISTANGTMALPGCSALGTFNNYMVPISIAAGTPFGVYSVVATSTVNYTDNTTLTQTRSNTVVCLVEPAPGNPGVPRLNLELLSPSLQRAAPGDQSISMYRVTNNDPTFSVSLTAFANVREAALKPNGANELQGVFAIQHFFGDDFPIAFNPSGCIPLPAHPFTQPEISMPLPVIPPNTSMMIPIGIRSYGQCGSGSCAESTLKVSGTFSNAAPALACAALSHSVDTSLPTTGCGGMGVNDCNANGIPDALDVINHTSQDTNFNALPDECEPGFIKILNTVQVTPQLVSPGQGLQVSLITSAPVMNAWANGVPMSSMNGVNWIGTILADTRPGPQTVYALVKDATGKAATHIGTYRVRANKAVDFDGDGRSDISVYRPSNGTWYLQRSTAGFTANAFGVSTDRIASGDYDGDGKTDLAVYRPSTGIWYIMPSSNNTLQFLSFGVTSDVPVAADYNGDGLTDIAVWRESSGTFYVSRGSSTNFIAQPWGTTGDLPMPGDYDGDGKADFAVFRPSTGVWYVLQSSNNTLNAIQWGMNNDIPVTGDFDGDAKDDRAVYRPSTGTWYILQSSNNTLRADAFGLNGDIPAPGDYDGDNKTDLALFRPSVNTWYIKQSSNNLVIGQPFGASGDVPVPITFTGLQ